MENLENLEWADDFREPSIVEKRFVKARRNYWKYRNLEIRVRKLKDKWNKKLRYYNKKMLLTKN